MSSVAGAESTKAATCVSTYPFVEASAAAVGVANELIFSEFILNSFETDIALPSEEVIFLPAVICTVPDNSIVPPAPVTKLKSPEPVVSN